MIRRYYSILSPVSLGTFPGWIHVTKIHNFDHETEIPEIQQSAWGYFETSDKVTKHECQYYGLVMTKRIENKSTSEIVYGLLKMRMKTSEQHEKTTKS